MFFCWFGPGRGLSFETMRDLSLHHLSALDAAPVDLARIAARCGCRFVTLFTYMPSEYRRHYPMADAAAAGALAEAMAGLCVACNGLEVFPLMPDPDWAGLAEGLRIGGMLGARVATVHSHIPDPAMAVEQLVHLADIAADHGIKPVIEFNPYSRCATLAAAVDLAERVAVQERAVGLVLDTLHAMRSGATLEDIARAAEWIDCVQISDGPLDMPAKARWTEAIGDRMVPGQGEFPLAEILARLGPGVVVDVEVPRAALARAGVAADIRCRDAVQATRVLLGGQALIS